jgi:hypothetical protein
MEVMMGSRAIFLGLMVMGFALAGACAGDEKSELNEGGKASTSNGASAPTSGPGGHGGAGTGGELSFGGFPGEECDPAEKGLACEIAECGTPDGTTIVGKAFAPNGNLPLYNVALYIPKFPDEPLEEITTGAACEQCPTNIENYVSLARSDSKGNFKLTNVPVGSNIPLVLQIGKWRRKITLPSVNACTENVVTDPNLSRLPKNQTEGDIPQMAVSTGSCDPLPCLFRKIGLDDAEFTDSTQGGRVHVFRGESNAAGVAGGNALKPEQALWNTKQNLMPYDMVFMACECSTYPNTKSATAKNAMRDYLNDGGRVFASHYHYEWFANGPPEFQAVANWTPDGFESDGPFKINNGFPKGLAFQEWLNEVANVIGDTINLTEVRLDLGNINVTTSTAWIYKPSPLSVKYFTFNTPVYAAPEVQCGRAVFSDVHVSSGSVSTVPTGCNNNPLTDQEKALVFLYFDLAACITPDNEEPCKPNGETCTDNSDCCEGVCVGGFCQPPS